MVLLSPTALIAFLGGVAPALIWLGFWLFEDRCEPEPKRYIFFTFIAGMVTVVAAVYLEKQVVPYLDPTYFLHPTHTNPQTLFAWACIEDICIFAAAYVVSLRSWVFDEPIDAIVYMVTAALGFAAAENTLFLFSDINNYGLLHGISNGDLRFIGATVLHTLSAGTVGIALALSFYKSRTMRALFALCGVILGITLHTLFNFFILNYGDKGYTFFIFLIVWFGIVAVLSLTEKIKQPARDYC